MAFWRPASSDSKIERPSASQRSTSESRLSSVNFANRVCSEASTVIITPRRLAPAGVLLVRRALKEVGDKIGDLVCIRGAVSTGSGRYLTGDFISADLVINEITAQAFWTIVHKRQHDATSKHGTTCRKSFD